MWFLLVNGTQKNIFPIFLTTSTGLINSLFPFCSHQILSPNQIYRISFSLINVVISHFWKWISFFVLFRSSYNSLVLYIIQKKDTKRLVSHSICLSIGNEVNCSNFGKKFNMYFLAHLRKKWWIIMFDICLIKIFDMYL